jgi:hypothetical protein
MPADVGVVMKNNVSIILEASVNIVSRLTGAPQVVDHASNSVAQIFNFIFEPDWIAFGVVDDFRFKELQFRKEINWQGKF